MSWQSILIMYFAVFIIFTVLHCFSRNKRPFRRAFISMICGLFTLLAVNISGIFTGIYLPVSLLSVTAAVIGGIPGITLMLALNILL